MVTPNDETPIVEESPLAGDSEATPKVPRKKKRDKKKKKKTKTRDDDDDEEKRDDEVADDGDDDKSTSTTIRRTRHRPTLSRTSKPAFPATRTKLKRWA